MALALALLDAWLGQLGARGYARPLALAFAVALLARNTNVRAQTLVFPLLPAIALLLARQRRLRNELRKD